jgi:conjugative transfer signal peptidase TraF
MKPIVAKAGDAVALSHAGVAVNGKLLPNTAPLLFDTKNRPLAHWPFGKYLVARGNVWVVSSFNRRSFDSRYFGPIAVSSIRTRLRPIMTE